MTVQSSSLPSDTDELKTLVLHYANHFDKATDELNNLTDKFNHTLDKAKSLTNEKVSLANEKDILFGENKNLKSQILVLKKLLWKPKTEKLPHESSAQAYLFNELEDEIKKAETKKIHVKGYSKSGKKLGRKPINPDLIRKEIIHDISDEERETDDGKIAVKIGEEVSEKLVVVPSRAWVEKHIRYKYKYVNKFGSTFEEDVYFKTAKMPPCLLPKTMATPELLAYIIISKFNDHLPLYRLENIFKRSGVYLTRATMSNWLIKVYKSLEIFIDLFIKELKKGPIINIDESPLQVIKEDGRSANQQSYMWLFVGGSKDHPIYYYHYSPSRSSSVVIDLLKDYDGVIGSDGYSAYKKAARELKLDLAGCNAHARRKFKEASEAAKNSSAKIFLELYKKLYRIETYAKKQNHSPEEITKLRQEKSLPIMNEFLGLLRDYETKTPPSFPLGKAISYALNNWKELSLFLSNGNIPIDNNHVERGIKPFVIGRKNWMFSFSADGAKTSASLYSVNETAKANGLDEYTYWRHLLKNLPYCEKEEDYLKLLPTRISEKEIMDTS